MLTIADVADMIAAATSWDEYDAHRWTVENAVGGGMAPTGSGYSTLIDEEAAATLLDIATHLDEQGAYIEQA